MKIKTINTIYNGYKFRSRLEARWAVFFDVLNIPYEYEKEGFDLDDVGWYLPDFWLPEQHYWIEIKGQEPTKKEKNKKTYTSIPFCNCAFPGEIYRGRNGADLRLIAAYDQAKQVRFEFNKKSHNKKIH